MYLSMLGITHPVKGFDEFTLRGLGSAVILAGKNGSGKSRLLKLLTQYQDAQAKSQQGVLLSAEDKRILECMQIKLMDKDGRAVKSDEYNRINFLNYSQYDLPLQLPNQFSPYVISLSKENLSNCNFEESAQDALLYISYLSKYYKYDCDSENEDELEKLNDLLKTLLGERIKINDGEPYLFGLPLSEMQLSPGQQYLLRMCVSLHCNRVKENSILLLDEPETHLHPDALLRLIEELKKRFQMEQIWIATHSVALLSIFNASDIWYMAGGMARKLGSRSGPMMEDLLGEEKRRTQLRDFIEEPTCFACNEFAYECLREPATEPYKKLDPQVKVAVDVLTDATQVQHKQDLSTPQVVVVDFGAGKGRFLEGAGIDYPDLLQQICYYAYDKYSTDAETCLKVMAMHNIDRSHYYNDLKELLLELKQYGLATHVLLVNVLHEIKPENWFETFNDIASLLRDGGKLILVEVEELYYGEKPYKEGFMVVQKSAMSMLLKGGEFLCHNCMHPHERVVRYQILKETLQSIDFNSIVAAVEEIGHISLCRIQELRKESAKNLEWLSGVRLAFWTHQYVNAQLFLNSLNESA